MDREWLLAIIAFGAGALYAAYSIGVDDGREGARRAAQREQYQQGYQRGYDAGQLDSWRQMAEAMEPEVEETTAQGAETFTRLQESIRALQHGPFSGQRFHRTRVRLAVMKERLNGHAKGEALRDRHC